MRHQPCFNTCRFLSALLLCLAALLALPLPLHAQSFISIAAGDIHSLGIKSDGALWAWGDNTCGQLGSGGPPGSGMQKIPTQVGEGYAEVAAGALHSLGLKTDGSLWEWGGDEDCFMTGGTHYTPALVAEGFTAITTAYRHSLALKLDGALWKLEQNFFNPSTPKLTLLGEDFVAVAGALGVSLGLKKDGSLWGCGSNSAGLLGSAAPSEQKTLIQIGAGYSAIAAGYKHALALKPDGSLWAWGKNEYGQLGNGTTKESADPVLVGDGFAVIAAGYQHSLGIKTDGSLWAWGRNDYGQLGDGATTDHHFPVQVGENFAFVAGGTLHSLGLKIDGSLWAWGYNRGGQLGDGTTTDRLSPVLIDAGDSEQYRYYVPYSPGAEDFALGFGISNINNTEAAGVVVDYYNNNGVHLGQDFTTIPAGGHASFMRGFGYSESGWARVTSSQPVEGMALAFGTGDDPMFDMDFKAGLSEHLTAAHVDTGANWISRAMLANPNGEPANVTITFHTDDGATQTADLTIPALGAVQYGLADAFPGLAGAIEVESSQGLAGFVLYDGRSLGNYVGGLSMVEK